MAAINNPAAYFKRAVMNSLKNEYRQNDNAHKHITPVGDAIDQHRDRRIEQEEWEYRHIVRDPQTWLMFMESESLHSVISRFDETNQSILFLMFAYGYTQQDVGRCLGISQKAVSKRWNRMRQKIIKEFSKKGSKK